MARSPNPHTDLIVGRSLLTTESIAAEVRKKLVERLGEAYLYNNPRWQIEAMRILREFEPALAELVSTAELSSWVAGYSSVDQRLPNWFQHHFRGNQPPGSKVVATGVFFNDPPVRFPLIENAAKSLLDRQILTPDLFAEADSEIKARAFTVANEMSTQTLGEIRDVMQQNVSRGASLSGFRDELGERLRSSFMGPSHLENVYRTNVQAAFRDGRESLASNPMIEELFPYQEYLPIHDARTRREHLALGSLGLDGTGVYRRDDPIWDRFTPPWDYQCRCGVNHLTIRQAARKGVKEAQRWLDTGVRPENPGWRHDAVPFESRPGFGSRGRITVGVN